MQNTWVWLLLAVLSLGGEVLTGTLYLLTLAFGFGVAGGLAAFGAGVITELVACAATIVAGIFILSHFKKWSARKKSFSGRLPHNPDNLDIGQQVQVDHWVTPGVTRVWYRGAQWEAVLADAAFNASLGPHTIVDVRGNQLVLQPLAF